MDEHQLVVEVRDRGGGIPFEHQLKVLSFSMNYFEFVQNWHAHWCVSASNLNEIDVIFIFFIVAKINRSSTTCSRPCRISSKS